MLRISSAPIIRRQLPVQVIISVQLPSSNVARSGLSPDLATLEGQLHRYYELYRRLHLQFYVLLIMGA